MKKILFFIFLFICIGSVDALNFYEGDFITGEYINKVDGNKTYYMTMQYIHDGNGTELGKSDSDIILRQQNDCISFIQNNTEVAYISDSTLYITDAHFLVSIRIGDFAFKPRANANLSLVKVN